MGGSGSSRWQNYRRKFTVEECLQLRVLALYDTIRKIDLANQDQIFSLGWHWKAGPYPGAEVVITFKDSGGKITAYLTHGSIGQPHGNWNEFKYSIGLESTRLAWGSKRWWWQCPECGKRAGILYLPPESPRFACRLCHHLKYASQLESYSNDLFPYHALGLAGRYPYLTMDEINRLIYCQNNFKRVPRSIVEKLDAYERHLFQERMGHEQYADSHPGFLTAEQLGQEAGLSLDALHSLADTHLLWPDTTDGRYRPKLAGWAEKLTYLLNEGWSLEEIQAWAKGRWSQPNPRLWPPERSG
jgi:hypothetical protein